MKKRHAFSPTSLDLLENRVVLSQGMMPTAAAVPVETSPERHQHLVLSGTIKGTEVPNPQANPVAGDLLLRGKGVVAPLGPATLLGTMSIRSGEPTFYNGRVSLSNGRGSILVDITGIQGGPTRMPPAPVTLHYKILGGFGAYRGAYGTGEVVYTQFPPTAAAAANFSLSFVGPVVTPPT